MKKNELMNGDVIVLKSGSVAVVIARGEESWLMFRNSGFESLNAYYSDDLVCEDFGDAVMQVYRPLSGFGFDALDSAQPIWERDKTWVRPGDEERARERIRAEMERRKQFEKMRAVYEGREEDRIEVLAQQFCGNCRYISLEREKADAFLQGLFDGDGHHGEETEVERRMVRLPGSEDLVIVYDEAQEDRYVREEYPALLERMGEHYRQRWGEELPMKVSCEIPQIGLTIHTRCFACRIDENGNLQSLRKTDYTPVFMHFTQN